MEQKTKWILFYVITLFLFSISGSAGVSPCKIKPFEFSRVESADPPVRQLMNYVSDNQTELTRVDDFLACLPEAMRKAPRPAVNAARSKSATLMALVYKSQSLQADCVDPTSPRVVLVDKDTFIAFTGHQERPECNSVEVMGYVTGTSSFELYQLQFVPPDLVVRHPHAVTSERNPQLCLSCHRQDPRPNWNPYFYWPGVYGSIDGSYVDGSREASLFNTFIAENLNHGPYEYLDLKPLTNPSRYTGPGSDTWASNRDIGIRFNALNLNRIQRKIIRTPDFEKYKYAIEAGLSGCEKPEETIPVKIRSQFKLSLDALSQDTAQKELDFYQNATLNLEGTLKSFVADGHTPENLLFLDLTEKANYETQKAYYDKYGYRHLAKMGTLNEWGAEQHLFAFLRYVFENRSIDITDWNMKFQTRGSYLFNTGYANDLLSSIRPSILSEEDLEGADAFSGPFCEYLKNSSLKALSGSAP